MAWLRTVLFTVAWHGYVQYNQLIKCQQADLVGLSYVKDSAQARSLGFSPVFCCFTGLGLTLLFSFQSSNSEVKLRVHYHCVYHYQYQITKNDQHYSTSSTLWQSQLGVGQYERGNGLSAFPVRVPGGWWRFCWEPMAVLQDSITGFGPEAWNLKKLGTEELRTEVKNLKREVPKSFTRRTFT